MKRLVVTLTLFVVWTSVFYVPVHAADVPQDFLTEWYQLAAHPMPSCARVVLESDKAEYFLGENVLIDFVLENTGNEPVGVEFGGDYRGASRSLRFKVAAVDEAGNPAEDPDPLQMCFGGLGGPMALKPGERFIQSLPLMRYCDITKPGRYTIRATHDFGWDKCDTPTPAGEIVLTFRMPDAGQAECVVQEMLDMPPNTGASFGKRSLPYPDFSGLRLPVYTAILERLVREGNANALEGLALTPTPEATRSLIRLASESDNPVRLKVAQTLNERLPYPPSHYIPMPPDSKEEPRLSARGRLVERAWDSAFVPDIRSLAEQLLAGGDIPSIQAGAFMVVSCGTADDAPAVIKTLEQMHNLTLGNRTKPDDNILDLPRPIPDLLRAMDALHGRGYALHENLSGDAEVLLYFHFLSGGVSLRPERYPELLEAFGDAGWPPIREEAVRSIPNPMPAGFKNFVLARLEDPDLGVCRAACSVAGDSGDLSFVQPLVEIVATERHEWLLREASNAALKLGADYELYVAWADRLAESGLVGVALDALQNLFSGLPGSWSGRTDLSRAECLQLRDAWRVFLAKHEAEIRAEKRFSPDDPAVTPALVGRARRWNLTDGTAWPPD